MYVFLHSPHNCGAQNNLNMQTHSIYYFINPSRYLVECYKLMLHSGSDKDSMRTNTMNSSVQTLTTRCRHCTKMKCAHDSTFESGKKGWTNIIPL